MCLRSYVKAVESCLLLPTLVLLAGCDAVNPERPTPQPDITVYGNVLEVAASEEAPDASVVQVRIGMPRALTEASEIDGKEPPSTEKGSIASVTVTPETVVMLDGKPAALTDFSPGSEVVVAPVSGTTYMVGVSQLITEAAFFMDFTTYRGWQLPGMKKVAGHPVEAVIDDPALVNTSSVEHSPVPLAGGTVLYFASRLRPPTEPGAPWIGARRPGLVEPAPGQNGLERSYRTELGENGWTAPELVVFPGLDDASVVRLTWIDEEETECLVTIELPGQSPYIAHVNRARRSAGWGPPQAISALGEGFAADGVYLAGSNSMIAFVSTGIGLEAGDIYLYNPSSKDLPLPLDPSINTPGDEWAPRVGPNNELLFCRGDHQLILRGKSVAPLRLPLPHRTLISEANPTRDGSWLFFCMPKLTPVETDQNIWVAALDENLVPGDAVPVDEWRP